MKYKLSKKQLEELSEMEWDQDLLKVKALTSSTHAIFLTMDPIIEPLPKPSIKTLEDFKALGGWEYKWEHSSVWFDVKNFPHTLDSLKTATIRQKDLPSNSFLLSDCIEEAEEVSEIEKLRAWVKVWVKSEFEKRGED